jgi:hypothetical protein
MNQTHTDTPTVGEMVSESLNLTVGVGILLLPLILPAVPLLVLLLPLAVPIVPLALLAAPFLLLRSIRGRLR